MTIGFARRIATYKRLYLLTRQLERSLRLLANESRPIQMIIAGKAHPADTEAKETLRGFMAIRRAPHVGSRDRVPRGLRSALAPCLVAGVDLWLNLPLAPLEASGTSGMKSP
jgi:starch phosphorylase